MLRLPPDLVALLVAALLAPAAGGCLSNPTPHPAVDAGPTGNPPNVDGDDARAEDPNAGVGDAFAADTGAGDVTAPPDACAPDAGADAGEGAGCDADAGDRVDAQGDDAGPTPADGTG